MVSTLPSILGQRRVLWGGETPNRTGCCDNLQDVEQPQPDCKANQCTTVFICWGLVKLYTTGKSEYTELIFVYLHSQGQLFLPGTCSVDMITKTPELRVRHPHLPGYRALLHILLHQ